MAKKPSLKYESKTLIKSIKATSRVSCKLRENYYTFEFTEERFFPETDMLKINYEKEKEMLWNEVHAQVDAQVTEITDLYTKKLR